MKRTVFVIAALILVLPCFAFAQVPKPILDEEIRDGNSIRRRSIELERVKRDAVKLRSSEASPEGEIRFAEVKKDFEEIQKLQNAIVLAYTRGETINYRKIGEAAAEMSKNALRLDANLFESKPQTAKIARDFKAKPQTIRDLIIELDKRIGIFVANPIFKNTKLVNIEMSEKSRLDLEKILRLSERLAAEAKKMQ